MNIYGFGSNGSGQLGIGHRLDVSRPERCQFREDPGRPVKVIGSSNTTFIFFDDGRIHYAGADLAPKAYSSPKGYVPNDTFRKLNLTEEHPAKLCSASWEALVVVTAADELYVCGRGQKGELGLGPELTATNHHVRIDQFPPKGTIIVDVDSSVSHTVMVLSNGEAYGWGNGRKGQLGEPSEIVWVPRRVGGLNFKVLRAVCGREFTLFAGEPSNGHFAVFGVDKWGLKSQGPKRTKDWKDMSASWGSIFILEKDGSICSWGRNEHGQLPSKDLPPISSMAVGSEHSVALTEGGSVVCWGWGEHGNCGVGGDRVEDTRCQWNEIQTHGVSDTLRNYGVGAGCATTFFWIGVGDP